jgi:hypothetical protein
VGGNLTIADGGKIYVDSKGYAATKGPGAGTGNYTSASHGGVGGTFNDNGTRVMGLTYGSVTNPVNAGSGSKGVSGGGVVVLTVGGTLAMNGSISAKGQDQSSGQNGAGAGGSINIVAGNLTIAAAKKISANGGDALAPNGKDGGGGGRIAIVLTNASDAAFASWVASANIVACGGLMRTADFEHGAAGTVYIKGTNNTYGTLVVNNLGRGANYYVMAGSKASRATTLIRNNTLLFDSIICTNYGVLAISSSSVLDLSQGCVLRSDSTPANITSRLIIGIGGTTRVYGGLAGSVTWPASYTNTGTISVGGTTTVALSSDFTIGSGGILTHEALTSTGSASEDHKLIASVSGDLTINTGGAIGLTARGYPKDAGPGSGISATNYRSASHGGMGGYTSANGNAAPGLTYGSITNPTTAGSGGKDSVGGGVAILTVGGTLTLNGPISADGQNGSGNSGGGSGGSVNIVVGSLSGGDGIYARGGNGGTKFSGGGGGRIAIVTTNSDDSVLATMQASGKIVANGGALGGTYQNGGAGTVYLKGTNQIYGRLIMDNNGLAIGANYPYSYTYLWADVTDRTVGDVVLKNSARMALSSCTLTAYGSWSNAVATNAFSGGTVVLAGTSPATVWGGNTWNNLTITTAGKQVQFQTNVIQYVYGVPAWSNNVSLLPIQNGYVNNTYWKLFKPSWGATQDVGVVTVQWSDAMLNSGATFRAALGSTVSNTRNWLVVIPKGTMILLR